MSCIHQQYATFSLSFRLTPHWTILKQAGKPEKMDNKQVLMGTRTTGR